MLPLSRASPLPSAKFESSSLSGMTGFPYTSLPGLPGFGGWVLATREPFEVQNVRNTRVSTARASRTSIFSYSVTFTSFDGRNGRAPGFLTMRSFATRSIRILNNSGGLASATLEASNGWYSGGVVISDHSASSGAPWSGICPRTSSSLAAAFDLAKACSISSGLLAVTPTIRSSAISFSTPSAPHSAPS